MIFEQPPEEELNKEETGQEKYDPKKEIEDYLQKGFLGMAKGVAEKNNISEESFKELVREDIFANFTERNHKDTLNTMKSFFSDEEIKGFLNDEKFINLGKDRVGLKLSRGDIDGANEVLNDLNIDEKFLETEEAKKAAETGIRNILALDEIDKAREVQKMFNIDKSFMDSAVKDEIKIRLKNDLGNGAVSLQKTFDISPEFIKEAVKEEILSRLSTGKSFVNIKKLIDDLNIDISSLLKDEEVEKLVGSQIDSIVKDKEKE